MNDFCRIIVNGRSNNSQMSTTTHEEILFGETISSSPPVTSPIISSEPHAPTVKKNSFSGKTVDSIIQEDPQVAKFILITEMKLIESDQNEQRALIRKSVQESVISLQECLKTIVLEKEKVKQSNNKIWNNMEHLKTAEHMKFMERVHRYLLCEIELQRNQIYMKHFDEANNILNDMMNVANCLQRDHPDSMIHFKSIPFLQFIQTFPNTYLLDKHHKLIVKSLKQFETVKLVRIVNIMDDVFRSTDKLIDANLNFFIDTGTIEAEFEQAVSLMPKSFQKHLTLKRQIIIDSPRDAGAAIIDLSNEFIKKQGLKHHNALRVIFVLFTRYFFSQFYIEKPFPPPNDDFANRIDQLKRLNPLGFPHAQKFLPLNLISRQFVDFPKKHPYTPSVELFRVLQYQTNPLDFCLSAHKMLSSIQETAVKIQFDKKSKETGQVLAKTDYNLSLDDLFDITMIVLILTEPFELITQMEYFSTYQGGLKLPSELDFAFTSLNALCSNIMAMNIDEFVQTAHELTLESQEVDPLNIA